MEGEDDRHHLIRQEDVSRCGGEFSTIPIGVDGSDEGGFLILADLEFRSHTTSAGTAMRFPRRRSQVLCDRPPNTVSFHRESE